jgi:hypothetical protein
VINLRKGEGKVNHVIASTMMRGWFPIFHEVEVGSLGEISTLVKKALNR